MIGTVYLRCSHEPTCKTPLEHMIQIDLDEEEWELLWNKGKPIIKKEELEKLDGGLVVNVET